VFEQSPSEGMLMYPGETVTLMVSKGKAAVEVPNVSGIGLSRSDAEIILTDAGLTSGGIVLKISDAKIGTVVGQEPAAGDMAQPFSEVVLYVSGECGTVPPLAGLTVEEARSALAASGFLLGEVRERFDETEPGLVVAQSLGEGTKALIGESVDVIISQIMPQSYYAETSITVEVDSDDAEILCILMDEEGGMREVYRERSETGVQTINLSLDSYVQGEQMLCVYVWDELVAEQKIVFE
jgi:beta-lactam-binding protein with PASTA domain